LDVIYKGTIRGRSSGHSSILLSHFRRCVIHEVCAVDGTVEVLVHHRPPLKGRHRTDIDPKGRDRRFALYRAPFEGYKPFPVRTDGLVGEQLAKGK